MSEEDQYNESSPQIANQDEYPNIKPWNGNCNTYLLTIHGFKLRDPDKGFEMENREILFVYPHSVQSKHFIEKFQINQKDRCDPLLPYKYYDSSQTLYMMQYNFSEHTKEYFNNSGIPRFLLKRDYNKMSPEDLAAMYDNLSNDVDVFLQETTLKNDPDSQYFIFCGDEFISCEERRAHEKIEPFVYVYYTISVVHGCEHYYRDAFPVCNECQQVVPCRFCHDDNIYDHKVNRQQYELMQCLFCGKIGPIGNNCTHCQKTVSEICCPICKTLCQIPADVKPAYHCDKCNVCRVGIKELSCHCDKCGCCYDAKQAHEHRCQTDVICSVCCQNLSDSITPEITLPCNENHRIHASCYDQLLSSNLFTCPIDHKVILDEEQYAMLRAKVYHIYKTSKVQYQSLESKVVVIMSQCYDCQTYSCDFQIHTIPSICHKCFGINTFNVNEYMIDIKNFLKLTNVRATQDEIDQFHEDMKVGKAYDIEHIPEYIMKFRSLHQTLVPQISVGADYLLLRLLDIFGNQ